MPSGVASLPMSNVSCGLSRMLTEWLGKEMNKLWLQYKQDLHFDNN